MGNRRMKEEAPYRIVISDEKRMAGWIQQVTTLKIVDGSKEINLSES